LFSTYTETLIYILISYYSNTEIVGLLLHLSYLLWVLRPGVIEAIELAPPDGNRAALVQLVAMAGSLAHRAEMAGNKAARAEILAHKVEMAGNKAAQAEILAHKVEMAGNKAARAGNRVAAVR
jgi:hypothetical protein